MIAVVLARRLGRRMRADIAAVSLGLAGREPRL